MTIQHIPNLIIGGGPSGLNMALELSKRKIDYLIFEASNVLGGQWDRFPICGQLISLNKRYVPNDNHHYRMRYDWHTLSTVSEEDVRRDPKLRFTEWTSEHWPSAQLYKEYLQYVAEKMGLMEHIRTNMRVSRISRPDKHFVVETVDGQCFTAERLFCGTGASEAVVPDIKGLSKETATFYRDFDPDTAAERYKNKIVVIIGRGNSAMEIAKHLINITAETRVITRSVPLFARQTHSSHDLRSHVSEVFDLMQLKSNNSIVSDRIVEVNRIDSGKHKGRLSVRYETPCPHWSPPRWMKRTGIIDDIIICCGFNYTMNDVFDMQTVKPDMDENGKYFMLSSSWESVNVPDLYFIGAPMRVNDVDAASGFIHGFRCNIQALADLVGEKYYDIAVNPIFETRIDMNDPAEGLVSLSEFLVEFVSNNVALFELFSYFGSIVTYEKTSTEGVLMARVWPPFSREYNQERWKSEPNRVEITFEYGFHLYSNGDIPTHYFTLPADHFDSSKSAYLHPVFHVFRDGIEVETFHMQESLISRWDIDDYVDTEANPDQYKNVVFNASACVLGLDERRSLLPVREEYIDKCYPIMTQEEVAAAINEQPTLAMLSGSHLAEEYAME